MTEERITRLERAVGQLGVALFDVNVRSLAPELRELTEEWQRTVAERIPPRPAHTAPHPDRYAPVFNRTMDLELREAASDER